MINIVLLVIKTIGRCMDTLTGLRSHFKVNGYTFRGSNSYFLFFASHLIRGQLLKKRICSPRSKFFPLRVGPVLEGLDCQGKRTGNHESCSPLDRKTSRYTHTP